MSKQNNLENKSPFFIGLNRTMVSLGPLSKIRYCPFNCAFCYVQSLDFNRYSHWDNIRIITYLKKAKKNGKSFNIIYISGDTDSFAPPRTEQGIKLLESLEELNIDITFTTRTTFNKKELIRLGAIAKRQKNKKLMFVAAISIPRLDSATHLESGNTPKPRERIQTLKNLKEKGLFTILAIRPFLPIIPINEYKQIIDLSKDFVDIVLGESWYTDKKGIIEKRVFQGPTPSNIEFISHKMDFDYGGKEWKLWRANKEREAVEKFCRLHNIPFFMRSKPAFDLIRKKYYLK